MNIEIDAAIEVLKQGGVILYPTDTVWGIGCDATNEKAVARVFEIKHRSDSKSLITLVSDADMLCRYIDKIPEIALNLIEINDRPMTIIYPGAIGLAPNVIASDGSVGIRIPDNEFCKKLISKFHKPIVSTSANISGEATPAFYKDINLSIIDAVDWVADPYLEEGSTGKASQVIKVGLSGEVEILRK
ncbi:MAG: L-threonylcarbamoyladenylate synthase [Bacteroidales bacterium]|nr:L-threonylcarbamoyladenylate synthase [Bacteroidales bacterium]MDD4671149.1 L-threonylcarbamoyladenylate synthase [Bacteroidales bacterium]